MKTLLIGDAESITGPVSDALKYAVWGSQVAKDYINNHGGITVNGQKYMIDLYQVDDKSTPDGAAAAANELVYDKHVSFIVGGGPAFEGAAITSVTEPAGVLYITDTSCGTPMEISPKFPLKFAGWCTFGGQKAAMAYLKQLYSNVKTITYILVDDGQIRYNDPVIRASATQFGFTIQGDIVGWTLDTVDFAPIAQKAVSRNTDAIMMGMGPTHYYAQMIKNIRALGYTKPIVSSGLNPFQDLLTIAGPVASTNILGNSVSADQTIPNLPDITKEVFQMAKAKYGLFNTNLDVGFTTVYTVVQAIQAAQSLDPKVVAAVLEKMDKIDTVYGPGNMGGLQTYGVNHCLYRNAPQERIDNGKITFGAWIPVEQVRMP